jgi:uncharacterized cupredoxin-like copper-binding protein
MVPVGRLRIVDGAAPGSALLKQFARHGFAVVRDGDRYGIAEAGDVGRQIRIWVLVGSWGRPRKDANGATGAQGTACGSSSHAAAAEGEEAPTGPDRLPRPLSASAHRCLSGGSPGRRNLPDVIHAVRSPRVILAAIAALVIGVILVSASLRPAVANPRGGSIVLEDLRFTPNRLDARVGIPMTVTLQNDGTQVHDFRFPSLHMPGLEGIESILQPGETRTLTLTFDQPGEHVFICSLPGHAAAGMTGAVFVKP